MIHDCQQLYEEMLETTGFNSSNSTYYPGWAQHCLQVSARAGVRLQKMLDGYTFSDEYERRLFFTTWQPKICGLVEYFRLVYTAELLVLADPARQMEYWNRELGKTWQFLMKHEAFYLSYKQGLPRKASGYPNNLPAYSDLATLIVAREKYMEYLRAKLALVREPRRQVYSIVPLICMTA